MMCNDKIKITGYAFPSVKLQLSLKKQWFDMTAVDGKSEEYREITPYWCTRLLEYQGMNIRANTFKALFTHNAYKFVIEFINHNYDFKHFDYNVMTLGYPSKDDRSRFKTFEHAGIEIRTGNPQWGAEPNKLYFVIKHGKKI